MNRITVSVAGISFAFQDNLELKNAEINIDDPIFLHKEPQNNYDSKAIRIEWNEQKIGYIPRKKDGVEFIVQNWCHENIEKISGFIDQVWYKSGETLSVDKSEGSEIVGIDVTLKIPESSCASTDKIITKNSISEPHIIVDFNDTQHVYNMRCDGEYKILKGGTTFIKRFFKPFDAQRISRQCAKYWNVTSKDIQDLWNSNGQVSGAFGTVVHEALEHYINHKETGETIAKARRKSGKDQKENYALPKHPFLKKVIKSLNKMTDRLDKEYQVEEVIAEALITDSSTGWGGLVDRLAVIDSKNKIARVQDYKVNVNAEVIESHSKPLAPFSHMPANKLTKYALQMSFYGALLEKHGWTIEGLDVFIFEDKWIHRELEMVDFSVLKK